MVNHLKPFQPRFNHGQRFFMVFLVIFSTTWLTTLPDVLREITTVTLVMNLDQLELTDVSNMRWYFND